MDELAHALADEAAVESREEGHRLRAEIDANERREPIKGTFKEYGEWWLANCATGNIKDSTYEKV